MQGVAPQAFKTVINGNEKLLEVHGGATNRDLVLVANAPEVLGFDPTARFVDYITRVASAR